MQDGPLEPGFARGLGQHVDGVAVAVEPVEQRRAGQGGHVQRLVRRARRHGGQSLQGRIAGLPGDYEVYPGHAESSMLSIEREHNPYVRHALEKM